MGIIQTNPGSPLTVGPASGRKIYAFNNISTAPQQVVGANVNRQSLVFHNPGDVDIFVAPSISQSTTTGSDQTLTPTTALLGGCFRIFANGGSLTIQGECQGAWQAFSASSNGKPLTVMDSNI